MRRDDRADDPRVDELARLAAIVTDPFYGMPVPPPKMTAAQLIAEARRRRNALNLWHRWRCRLRIRRITRR